MTAIGAADRLHRVGIIYRTNMINVEHWFGPWLRVWACGVAFSSGFGLHRDRPFSAIIRSWLLPFAASSRLLFLPRWYYLHGHLRSHFSFSGALYALVCLSVCLLARQQNNYIFAWNEVISTHLSMRLVLYLRWGSWVAFLCSDGGYLIVVRVLQDSVMCIINWCQEQ